MLRFEPEGRVVIFDPAWLLANAYDKPPPNPGWTAASIARWDAPGIAATPVEDYNAVRTNAAARPRFVEIGATPGPRTH